MGFLVFFKKPVLVSDKKRQVVLIDLLFVIIAMILLWIGSQK